MIRHPHRTRSFTLVELLAVVMVILVLAGIMLGAAGYVQTKMATATAKVQIAAMGAALEAYKADWGFYPPTSPVRISATGFGEATNNWILYCALSGANGGKRYQKFPANQLRVNIASGSTSASGTGAASGGRTNICDPWGAPYNYYCSPKTAYGVSNGIPSYWPTNALWYGGYTVGGQVNVGSYDLFSYGSDKSTYVPGAIPFQGGYNYAWYYDSGQRWTNLSRAFDDITNFRRSP